MDEFLREIQEDIQRQKWESLWARWGNMFMAFIALIIIGSGGWQVNKYLSAEKNTEQTDALIVAIESASLATVEQAELATEDTHQAFATVIKAQLQTGAGDDAQAKATLEKLAAEQQQTVAHDLARALAPADQPSRVFAETKAERQGWAAVDQGDYTGAVASFESIIQSEKDTPPSIVDRARAGLAYAKAKQRAAKDNNTEQ